LVAKTYSIEFTPAALRELESLPRHARKRVGKKIDLLAQNPRPAGAVAIKGGEGLLRLRIGVYRIIYRVEDDRLVVLLIRIGRRKEVYRKL
jgi:mRNA interferase RelE/StbE